MKILICSDGMPAADNATRIGGLLARACRGEATLLGIAEKAIDEQPLREALNAQAELMRAEGVTPDIVIEAGEPVTEILEQTSKAKYNLVVIGSRRTHASGLYWRSQKTYEVIKAIPLPVLVAMGDCQQLKRLLVCTGGKAFVDPAVQLTGEVAAALGASVTLLHVMAEPPAIYANLVRLEEDLDRLLESGSELGRNLVSDRKQFEALGVAAEVHVRHGDVVDQVFAEVESGQARHDRYGLIARAGSAAALHHGRRHSNNSEPGRVSRARRAQREAAACANFVARSSRCLSSLRTGRSLGRSARVV